MGDPVLLNLARRSGVVIALLAGLASPALASDIRVLESVDVIERGEATELRVGFSVPVRYIRHAPATRGSTLEVQIGTVSFGSLNGPSLFGSESLRPKAGSVSLVDVVYEGGRSEGPVLVLHFSRPVDFEVSQGTGLRTISVYVRDRRRQLEVARAPSPQPAPTAEAARAPALPLPPPTPVAPPPSAPPSASIPTPPSAASPSTARAATETNSDAQPIANAPAPSASPQPATAMTPPPPTPARAKPAPPALPPASEEQARQVAAWVAAARAALESGDLDTALTELTRAASIGVEAPASREAKELLGVTRERRGQLAHAKGEYEEYLARYPEGDDAARVRQRLDALLASQLAKLPASQAGQARAPGGRRPTRFDQYGSTSVSYRRYVHSTNSLGSETTDSSLQTDATYVLRGEVGGVSLRGQLAGAYRFDLLEGMDENDARISAVFLEANQREGPYGLTLGRQQGNTAGVISRFDGLRFRRKMGPHWRLSLLGGLPVDYYHSDTIDTGRYVYGLGLDLEELFGHLDGQVFAVQQRDGDFVDRTAVGLDLRWADETKFVSTYLDFDVDYVVLNTALLVANWRITDATNLNLLLDYRRSPILLTENALIGQPVSDLDELETLFTRREIRALAEDRTPTSAYVSLGGTHRLTQRWQLGIDVSGSRLSSTPASGGVLGTPSTGWELSVSPQLIATGLLKAGDIATIGFRYFDGATTTTYSLLLNERLPITAKLRLAPRLRVDWRERAGSDEFTPPPGTVIDPFFRPDPIRNGQLTVRSYLGAEYRLWKLTFDADCGVEWTDDSFAGEASLDHSLWFGLRYDF
jgi:hypothetical protein